MTTLVRRRAEQQLAAGACAQVVLLAALSAGAGLGPLGWLAGIAYVVGLWALLSAAARRAMITTLGAADLVTLARAVLVGSITAVVTDGFWNGETPVGPLVVIATVALVLDAVDGQVARRSGTASALGARFDMEVDAFLILVLSVHVATILGPWVLAIGAMRYAFVAASWFAPWLRSALPTRYSAKVVAALQGIALVVTSGDLLPLPLEVVLVATALALLVWSFGHDVVWLWRNAGLPRPLKHPVVARATTALAGLLLFLALLAPNEISRFTPGAFVRIPVEGIVGVALLLVVPAKRVVATLAGVALGLLTIMKVLDLGFLAILARPFDPVLDWILLDSAVEFLTASIGRAGAIGSMAAAAVLVTAVIVFMTLSVLRLTRLIVQRRPAAIRVVAVLAAAWIACAVLSVQIVPDVPVASGSTAVLAYDRALQARVSLREQKAFAAQTAVDAYRDLPGEQLLTALRGKDVVIVFVESYGRDAVENPEFAPQIGAVLGDGNRRLDAAGFASRSAFLTSPVAGGSSWLAHATFLSGLWIDSEQRYRTLVSSDRLTLTSAFRRASWQTIAVMPGTTRAWPEGAFYGYDRVYDSRNLGYRGSSFNWASMPDQYTLAAFERLEHDRPDRAPLMAEITLVSSHAPWTPIPRLVSWDNIGDGAIFDSMAEGGDLPDVILTRDTTRVRAAYRRSIEYSLNSVISYVETYGDDSLVLIVLGDHQPIPIVTGEGASRDVPITIVARDPAILNRISEWGWQPGLKPDSLAPVWRMDTFRDRFLAGFGP